MSEKATSDEIKKFFEDRGCTLIGTEHINADTKINLVAKPDGKP